MTEMKNYNRLDRVFRKTILYFVLSFFCLALLSIPVLAQDDSSTEDDEFTLEEVTVTGSRIRTSGVDTPTPVTVMVADEINVASPTTMIEGLAELPMFWQSNTTQNTGGFFESTGAGSLNLRGLESQRTLTLLDGRRVVPSTIFGGPDINLFPELLVRSFETVTGGASAAYGTDAVAGVTNFILDTDYQGIKGHVQVGATQKGHNKNYEIELAGGFELTDQTRILLSVEKMEQDPIWGNDILEYGWYEPSGLVPNPDANAGSSRDNPYYIKVPNLYSQTASINGIFYSGGSPVYTFDDAGNAVPWVASDGPCGFWNMMCSTPNADGSAMDSVTYDSSQISPEAGRENFFGYIEHDISHKLKVYGQAILGKEHWRNKNLGGTFAQYWGAFTVYRENPYLPQEIQDYMDTNSMDSISFGRIGGPDDIGFDAYLEQKTNTMSLTTGFEYTVGSGFFDDWQIKGYIQYGETKVKAIQRGGVRLDRIYLAMDVVEDDDGTPICNVVYQNRDAEEGTPEYEIYQMYQDCVPLNLFGAGNASEEAIDWVTGFEPGVEMDVDGFLSATESMPYSYTTTGNKRRIVDIDQTVFEVTADGDLYEGWGAGPISMAFGYNYREESFTQVVETGPGGNVNVDPTVRPVLASGSYPGIRGVAGGNAASGNIVDIQFSNVPFARGDQNVHEIFDEMLVPIVSDLPFVKQLNFNGAARWADYSGAGTAWSWKGGLDWSVNDELRFRSTLSHDVRAATIGEKYDRTGGIAANIRDYYAEDLLPTHLQEEEETVIYNATRYSNGSPDIQPEKATTKTMGLTYQPKWLEGLWFSMDWYSINIKDNINTVDSKDVVEGCYEDGIQTYCDMFIRGGLLMVDSEGNPILDDEGNQLTQISLVGEPYINKDSVKAVGIDFELGYRTPVDWFGGDESISARLLASYVGENSNTEDGVKEEDAGIEYPEWTATLSASYQRGPFGISITTNYTSKILIDRDWNFNGTSTRWDVYDNTLEAYTYTDAQVNYRFDVGDGNLNLFLNINNVFNRPPQPWLVGSGNATDNTSWFGTGTGLSAYGDLRGRRFVLGVEFEFK